MTKRRGRPPKGQVAMSTGERSAARRRRDWQAILRDGDVARASTSGLVSEICKAGPELLRLILVEIGHRRGLRVMIADAPGARFAAAGAHSLPACSGSMALSQGVRVVGQPATESATESAGKSPLVRAPADPARATSKPAATLLLSSGPKLNRL